MELKTIKQHFNIMILVNEPVLNGNEKKYLNECIDTGWISSEGPFVKRFETQFSKAVDRKFGIAVCNGTVALDLAVQALNIGIGDEVIMPAFTIISCAAAIVRVGAVPVLVDSESDTWNMNVNDIRNKITNKTKAIMVVHIYGLPVNMDGIMALAKEFNLKVIEDAAELHGQTYNGKMIGSFGDISTFSFYPNKHITTGEGGMVVTDDIELADKCRSLRNLCFIPEKRFVHYELGYNFRMTNLQAALGVAQLEQLDDFIIKKRHIGSYYQQLLANVLGIQLPLKETKFAKNIYWVFGIVLKDSISVDAEHIMRELADAGVGTRPFFYPMHLQPVFQNKGMFAGESYPVSELIANRGFYLPSGLAITNEQMGEVATKLKQILKKYSGTI